MRRPVDARHLRRELQTCGVIGLRHPAYDCFYLALAERNTSPLVTADDRLIRRCADTPFEKLVQSL
jgi:predicted nucleic acid-binding protein